MASSIFVGPFGFATSGGTFQWPLGTTLTETALSSLSLGPGTTNLSVSNLSANKWIGSSVRFLTGFGAGLANITDATEAAGVGLDVATNNILKVRTLAQTGYATLDCLGLKASGVAGATFGPGAVASLTVVNGIVTAAS